MRRLNQALCFIFFLLLFYLYIPVSMGQDEPGGETPPVASDEESNDIEDLRRRMLELEAELNELKENLPDVVEDEIEARQRRERRKDDRREARWRAANGQNSWSLEGGPRRHNLEGRVFVGPGPGYEGAYGVLFDIDSGANVVTGGGPDQVSFYQAKITPFIHLETWGAQMSMNVRKFLENEVISGELRDQISDQDFESAYVYYRPINTEQVEVIAYAGLVNEPFVREVVESSVFTNKSILDKYRLNTSMAFRVDLGLGRMDSADPRIVERPLWIQAASFNLDDNNDFTDFAVRVILSLSVLNRYANFQAVNLSPFQIWAGYAQLKSGNSTAGESDAVTNPFGKQEMTVFGMQFDLTKLTGRDLGLIYGEFVQRRRSGDLTDQSWIIGYEVKIPKGTLEEFFGADLLPHISEDGRPIEVGLRYQNQEDDPDVTVADGQVIEASLFYPLTDLNIGIRVNVGYIIYSTDPDRDRQLIFAAALEALW